MGVFERTHHTLQRTLELAQHCRNLALGCRSPNPKPAFEPSTSTWSTRMRRQRSEWLDADPAIVPVAKPGTPKRVCGAPRTARTPTQISGARRLLYGTLASGLGAVVELGRRQPVLKADSIHDPVGYLMDWCGRPSGASGRLSRAYASGRVLLLPLVCAALGMVAPIAASASVHAKPEAASSAALRAERVVTEGMVTVERRTIKYTATAGTIILKNRRGKPT
ncbi:MAG: hypothetical protein ACREBW_03920, partial [Candidatus Micrarchaeaceae archaeon]